MKKYQLRMISAFFMFCFIAVCPSWAKQQHTHAIRFLSSRHINILGPNLLAGCKIHGHSVYLAGTTLSPSNQSSRRNVLWIASLSIEGHVNWKRNIQPEGPVDELHALAVDAENNLYVAGGTASSSYGQNKGGRDVFIAKFSPSGQLLWGKQFGTPGDDIANGLCFTPHGDLCVTGSTQGSLFHKIVGNQEMFLILIKPDGSLILGKQLGDGEFTTGEKVTCDPQGNFYIVGETFHWFGKSQGNGDIFAAKFTPYGALIWGCQFGTPYADYAEDIGVDRAHDLYACGRLHDESPHKSSGFLAKVDANGHRTWLRDWVTGGESEAESLAVRGGAIYCIGATDAPLFGQQTGLEDGVLALYDQAGTLKASYQYGAKNTIEATRIITSTQDSSFQYMTVGAYKKPGDQYSIIWHFF